MGAAVNVATCTFVCRPGAMCLNTLRDEVYMPGGFQKVMHHIGFFSANNVVKSLTFSILHVCHVSIVCTKLQRNGPNIMGALNR